MSRNYIQVDAWAVEKLKDPGFKAAYDALADESDLATASIEARDRIDMVGFEPLQHGNPD